jgi:hypothetical protein
MLCDDNNRSPFGQLRPCGRTLKVCKMYTRYSIIAVLGYVYPAYLCFKVRLTSVPQSPREQTDDQISSPGQRWTLTRTPRFVSSDARPDHPPRPFLFRIDACAGETQAQTRGVAGMVHLLDGHGVVRHLRANLRSVRVLVTDETDN